MAKYYLGIDQGTTGTTALLINEKWEVMAQKNIEHRQIYPKPGWVEHDPEEIWEAIQSAMADVMKQAGAVPGDIIAIGLDHQGETCAVWDKKTGKPIYNALVWQDRRTAEYADELKEKHGEMIQQRTGLVPDAYFSATKIRWILDNTAGARDRAARGELLAGTLDAFIIWKFTGGAAFVTDGSTASRTMMIDLKKGQWDDELLGIYNIPKSILPEISDSSQVYGYTTGAGFFGAKVPIGSCITDALAATFAQGCVHPGDIKASYGTGVFMNCNIGTEVKYSPNGLITLCCYRLKGRMTYELEGGVYITGAAVQWLRDKLRIIENSAETEQMALSVKDTGGVYFVPAFSGLAAPHWDQYARGMMIGLTGGTTREQIVRATLEGTAFQVYDNVAVMKKDSGQNISVMRVDGGPVVNRFLMQFQADLLGFPVDVPVVNEMTAYGAGLLAAMAVGNLTVDDVVKNWKLKRRYEPKISGDERESLLAGWNRAIERCKNWEQPKN
ncbi:MAG: glycerol kinase GlpK [Spirochaetaceae bacterium]|jgi:glycerol kinase|nr:glycerol kinase GlpK [Spirochaetaceae bacterium]